MIGSVSSNSILSAAFGFGAAPKIGGSPKNFPGQINSASGQFGGQDHEQPVDKVELSDAAQRLAAIAEQVNGSTSLNSSANAGRIQGGTNGSSTKPQASGPSQSNGTGTLAPEDEAQVRKLREQDAEVRRHEQAHKASAGQYASGGPSFKFETGPDGRQYAVSGEVQIDASPVNGDPQATVRKMQQVRRAALAPGSPSSQDRAVAAQAAQTEQQARTEASQKTRDTQGTVSGGSSSATVVGGAQTADATGGPTAATTDQPVGFGSNLGGESSRAYASQAAALTLASGSPNQGSRSLLDLIA